MVAGTPAYNGPDGVAGTANDGPGSPVSPGGCPQSRRPPRSDDRHLFSPANGQDSLIKDIQDRIANWDLRLAKREETLTRQFTAMETALSHAENQSSWLAGQINSLPSWDSGNSSNK